MPNRIAIAIEFAEHRKYSQGDDLRFLDWKVYGRTDKYYIKEFEQETNLRLLLVVDTSESMAYQSAAQTVAVVYQQPVVYVPVVAGGICSSPNVIYFGGRNSCYSGGYRGSYYRPNCGYSPSVIYFGRGEACQRGYAFRHPR